MTCNGTPAAPGSPYTSDAFTASSSSLAVTCAGSPVGASVQSLGGGRYRFKLEAIDVGCPGPIVAMDGGTEVYCAPVQPCP